jgi:hypothetical protein
MSVCYATGFIPAPVNLNRLPNIEFNRYVTLWRILTKIICSLWFPFNVTAIDSALLNYEWNNFLVFFLFARSATAVQDVRWSPCNWLPFNPSRRPNPLRIPVLRSGPPLYLIWTWGRCTIVCVCKEVCVSYGALNTARNTVSSRETGHQRWGENTVL